MRRTMSGRQNETGRSLGKRPESISSEHSASDSAFRPPLLHRSRGDNALACLVRKRQLVAVLRFTTDTLQHDARTRRDEPTHDDVLLQADQLIDLAGYCRFCEHACGLLEGGR